jgi:DNA-binding NtrC family response regulator
MEKIILLIERDASLRRRYRMFLEFEGYRVVSAMDEPSARELIPRLKVVDLLIAALTEESSEALESLFDQLPNIPVLLTCEPGSPAAELPYPCLVKPIPPERLVFKVEQMLPAGHRITPLDRLRAAPTGRSGGEPSDLPHLSDPRHRPKT